MTHELQPMNREQFEKMALGDNAGLVELAKEYFSETRRLMTGWPGLIESGDFGQLCDELHRCKGGASLFGLERLVSLLGEFESSPRQVEHGFDLTTFELELTAAERAVAALTDTTR